MAIQDSNQASNNNQGLPPQETLGVFNTAAENNLNNQAAANAQWAYGASIDDGVVSSPSSEIISKIQDLIKNNAIVTPESNRTSIAIVRVAFLDNGTEQYKNFLYSALIVASQLRNRDDVMAFYPILIEKTAQKDLGAQSFDLGNGLSATIPWTPSETMGEKFYAACASIVKETFPGFSEYLPVSGMSTGPRADITDLETLRKLVKQGSRANTSTLMSVSTRYDSLVTLAALEKETQKFVGITAGKGQGQELDLRGLPFREDVQLESYSQVPQKQLNEANQGPGIIGSTGRESFSKVSGFMDFAFRDNQQSMYNVNTPQQALDRTRAFMGRFVMTNIDLLTHGNVNALMLALVSTSAMANQQVWSSVVYKRAEAFNAMNPSGSKEVKMDPTDIGVFGLMANLIDPKTGEARVVDTKTATFKPENYAQLLNMTVAPGIAFSIDIPRSGPQSWQQNILTGVARNSAEARKALIAGAQETTGGRFLPIFASRLSELFKTPISPEAAGTRTEHFYSECNNTLPYGFYEAAVNGERVLRDIRFIDLLYMANRDPKKADVIQNFAASLIPGIGGSYAKRMSDLLGLLSGVVSFSITDWVDRHTFSTAFLESLWQASTDAGFNPAVNFPGMLGVSNHQQAYAQYTAHGVSPQQQTFAGQGGMNYGGNVNPNVNNFNGWNV